MPTLADRVSGRDRTTAYGPQQDDPAQRVLRWRVERPVERPARFG
jgi:hypothetical protein